MGVAENWLGVDKMLFYMKITSFNLDSNDPWKGYHQIESGDRDFDDGMDAILYFK